MTMDAAPPPGLVRTWVIACRPATLTVALAPVLVGAAVAWHSRLPLRLGALVVAALGAVLLQVGANLANDVFDYEKGADTAERLGPLRVTQAGLLTPTAVRRGMVVSFFFAVLAGVYLLSVGGWPVLAIGLASIASAIAYTGGPYPLGYHGLGDVFVFAFFGPVAVLGTVFVTAGVWSPLAALASVPVGLLATAVLVVNNVRDVETDQRAGKRTLVARFGRSFGVTEYALCWAVSLVACAAIAVWLHAPWPALPWLMAPFGVSLARTVSTVTGRPLNATLGATARSLLGVSVLLAVGIALARG